MFMTIVSKYTDTYINCITSSFTTTLLLVIFGDTFLGDAVAENCQEPGKTRKIAKILKLPKVRKYHEWKWSIGWWSDDIKTGFPFLLFICEERQPTNLTISVCFEVMT